MDIMQTAQHAMDILRTILTFVSKNWDIIGVAVGILATKGVLSQKNAEIIGKVFDRNLSLKSVDLHNAAALNGNTDSAAMSLAFSKAEEILIDVVGSVAKESPLNPNDVKGQIKNFAKEIVLAKAGLKSSASTEISKGVKLNYDGDKFSVNPAGVVNKSTYKVKKFLKKIF